MSGVPFGFGPPGRSGGPGGGGQGGGGEGGNDPAPRSPDPSDPFGLLGAMGDPASMGAALQRLGQLLSWTGGPVNWDLARDVARAGIAGKDRSVGGAEREQVEQALRLADLWLDPATTLPAAGARAQAWSRAEWVEHTLPSWKGLVEPVAARVVAAMGETLAEQAQRGFGDLAGAGGMSPEALGAQLTGPLSGMVRAMGASMFGAQVGQGLAALAGEVVGSTDVGVPLLDGRAALLPAGVAAFAEGLEVPEEEVRLYLALREAAHQRLFAHVPWLRARLFGEVEAYASGITIDTGRIEEAVAQLDPSDPSALQEALGSGLFDVEPSPAQAAALARLETLLALVEGWVDEVVAAAAEPALKHAAALREAVRRRRATGGPAEQTFASLVGLELRPRRLREAAALWKAVADVRGIEGRDAVWGHPDLLPGSDDLDSPAAFAAASDDAAFDLSGLLADEPGPVPGAAAEEEGPTGGRDQGAGGGTAEGPDQGTGGSAPGTGPDDRPLPPAPSGP
ncbi:zinc-dependent metalloprotease [Motilibacter deserti]|uniref:Zinc-dependent metalloprotease n=1 Tax=Motilibacter deserti TaxID=2714956 RepID=A0ABX0GR03_9ACTN|nr:zinc-dependent metalloprotease [Motilibacter deserti]NHC13286.1 zinc-dependent metalloprotease [Motilibacter deserti]